MKKDVMSIDEIIQYVQATYDDAMVSHNWGERGLFYNPGSALPKGVYILTFKEKDGPNDYASKIDRGGIYRVNLGISKSSFLKLFGRIPTRPAAGEIVDTGHDFQQLDQVTPHPVYGWMGWVAVLNPSIPTFEKLKPLIDEGVMLSHAKFEKRMKTKCK